MEVMGQASNVYNTWSISQPGREYPGIDPEDWEDVGDYSDQFAVYDSFASEFFQTQRDLVGEEKDAMNKRWRIGVGVGVGLGVPIFMAASFAAGIFFTKRRGGGLSKKGVSDTASH
jgi:hypothetical protein